MRSRRRIPGYATWNRNRYTIKRDSGKGGARAAGRVKSSPAAQRCLLFYRLLINSQLINEKLAPQFDLGTSAYNNLVP